MKRFLKVRAVHIISQINRPLGVCAPPFDLKLFFINQLECSKRYASQERSFLVREIPVTASRTCNSLGRPKSDIEMHLRKSFHTSHIFRWFLGLIQVANYSGTCIQWTCIMNPGPTPCLISRQFHKCNAENRTCTWDARQISSTFCQSKKKHNWDIWKLPCLEFFEVELWWCSAENRGEKPSRQPKIHVTFVGFWWTGEAWLEGGNSF